MTKCFSIITALLIFVDFQPSALALHRAENGANTVGYGIFRCQDLYISFDTKRLVPKTQEGVKAAQMLEIFEHWVGGYMTARVQSELLNFISSDEVGEIQMDIIRACRANPQSIVGTQARNTLDAYIKAAKKAPDEHKH